MSTVQSQPFFQLQLTDIQPPEESIIAEPIQDLTTIEFDVITPVDLTDSKKTEIHQEIAKIDLQLADIQKQVDALNAELDGLTCHADNLDYIFAVSSGVLADMIDILWVGEFSLERGKAWSNEQVNSFVMAVAKKNGYTGDTLKGAIEHMEENFPIASDRATADFGGGLQHHLRDFSHHPTPVGLIFSMLTQFTGMAYGTDKSGMFKVIPVPPPKPSKKNPIPLTYIGETFYEKITFGFINWVLHMVSDMAGSSSNPGAGTGLPGPFLSLLKELSALPIFNNGDGANTLSLQLSKLFNGTLLAKRDAGGKIMTGADGKALIERFDLRAELGVTYEVGRQAIPVVVNEALVRSFYFLRRLMWELKEKKHFKDIDWRKTCPIKNRTIVRMLTIATGTFTAIDLADAGIRAVVETGGVNPATAGSFLLRVNFVGVGRFTVAVVTDVSMGIKKSKKETERMIINGKALQLLNAKVFYKQADIWIEAQNTAESIEGAYSAMLDTMTSFGEFWVELENGSESRRESAKRIAEKHPDLKNDILNILEWGC